MAFKAINHYLKLQLTQKKRNKVWFHGDLNKDNYFLSDQSKLYFIDFENMSYTRKWPLNEILLISIKHKNGEITLSFDLMKEYLKQTNLQFSNESLKRHIRFAFLNKGISVISYTRVARNQKLYTRFLQFTTDTLKFNNWFYEYADKGLKKNEPI